MPRRHGNASSPDAVVAARRRLASRLSTYPTSVPLLELDSAAQELVDPESDDKELDHARREPQGNGDASGPDRDAQPSVSMPDTSGLSPRFRWRTPRRAAVVLAIIAAVLIVWNFWQSAAGSSTSEPLASASAGGKHLGQPGDGPTLETPAPPASPSGAAGEASAVIVHVAGAVKKPGIVSLPQGSRVFQAIDAAGGIAPGASPDGLNLAEVLTDGVKVYVPTAGEAAGASEAVASSQAGTSGSAGSTGSTGASGTATGAKVNINTASAEELGTLPRVGPVMAQRIVDWRKEHGSFASVEELDAVDGIGPKLMESLQKLVTVNGG